MASFDFIDCAVQGYRFLMTEHETIGRMTIFPLLIKLVSFAFVITLGLEDNFMRLGLLLLPSYFAEGWLVALVVRLAIFGERGAYGPPGTVQEKSSASRSRGLMAGMVFYVLTKLLLSFFWALIDTNNGEQVQTPPPEASVNLYIAVIALMAGMLWAFRFMWLYVPAALDYPIKDFLRRIRGYMTSVYMLGTWLLCFTPMALMIIMASQTALQIFPMENNVPTMGYSYFMAFAQAVMEVFIAIVASSAMAYAIQSIYKKAP